MAEAYSVDAKLETQYDSLIAQAFRLEGLDGAVVASSAVGILRFYAYELSLIDVKDVDIVSVSDKHGGMDIVSRWSVKLLETGENHIGYCNNRWRLDRSGRRIIDGQSFCGLLPAHATLVSS
jgi:hypothetical protein